MIWKRVLVVVAHPDDEVLGCGASLSLKRASMEAVRVVFMAEGVSCRYRLDDIGKDHVKQEIAKRNEAARNALSILGIGDYRFHNLPCGRLNSMPIIDIAQLVEAEIRDFSPDTLLTHSNHDVHMDHRTVFQASLQATRPGSACAVDNLLSFEVPSSTEWRFVDQFQPNYFLDVAGHIDRKVAAMAAYDMETRPYPHPRSPDGIRAFSSYRGVQAGFAHAEAFQIIRALGS